jgi:hypothetical protein
MSRRNDITLAGMPADAQPLKQCAPAPHGCGRGKSPHGGIEIGPRWICAGCWVMRRAKSK